MTRTNTERVTAKGKLARRLRALLSSTMAIAIAACGGGGGGGSESDPRDGSVSPPPPPPPVGNPPSVTAEARAIGEIGGTVTLAATASDPDGDAITYSWQQDRGLPVSETTGFDSDTATFTVPNEVDTLVFTVTATADGQADSTVVRVIVVEDAATAVFVDGSFAGTSDGSIESPYSTLEAAVAASVAAKDNSDFYLKSLPGDESYILWSNMDDAVTLGAQSFYGGYDANWERDAVGNRTGVVATGRGLLLSGIDVPTRVSGLQIEVFGPDRDVLSYAQYGLAASSGSSKFVADNNAIFVNGPDGSVDVKQGSVFGVVVEGLADANVTDNVIETGDGTIAKDSIAQEALVANGAAGTDARVGFNYTGGAGGAQSGVGWNGGNGGDGGTSSFAPGEGGEAGRGRSEPVVVNGGRGGTPGVYNTDRREESPGGNGINGDAGVRGSSGLGGIGRDFIFLTTSRNNGRGEAGGQGWAGGGGGGGGGGSTASAGRNGGGGGGGGEGGQGGVEGRGGRIGGASVGLIIFEVDNSTIARNSITSGTGGQGGLGGTGGAGGKGGKGGLGADANAGSNAKGGDGGDGGDGGQGGYGGGGAGGPSYGIWVGKELAPVIEENTIVPGRGGRGAPPRVSFEAEAAGGGGWSYGIIDADPTDGIAPVLRNNTISAGTGGDSGHPDNPPGDSGDVLLQ